MNKAEFTAILKRQQKSGLSINAFCKKESYPASNFYYWKSKGKKILRDKKTVIQSTEFIPISISREKENIKKEAKENKSLAICIELPNGMKIHLKEIYELKKASQLITQICTTHVLLK